MIKSKKQMYMVIGIFALVLFLSGTTYAFFNYTRTGVANNIRTGRIYFNTTQSGTLNLTNVFPMSSTDAGNANLDEVSVRIQGDTTYANGEEFEISIVDVNNTIGSGQSAKTIPINYIASYSATPVQSGNPNVIGTNSDTYFTARGQSSAVYQLSATGEATNGEQVIIGFIPSGATGIDGTLTIKAYLDSSKIAISDTYNASDPETDTNGTTTDWVDDRLVLTTTEWNALQNTQTPLSFKIKAVSQEGTWVLAPATTPSMSEMCPGCKFMYITDVNTYNYGGANNVSATNVSSIPTGIVKEDYREVIASSGKNIFLGFTESNGKIDRAFACGIKGENPNNGIAFCIEGGLNDGVGGNATTRSTIYNANSAVLNDSATGIWQGECDTGESYVDCYGAVGASADDSAGVRVNSSNSNCMAQSDGKLYCHEY